MGHALGWVFDYGLKQGLEMAHQSFNGGTFEKTGVVFSRSLQGTLSFGNRKSQVKDRGSFFDVNWSRYQIRQLQLRARRILEHKQHLEAWAPAQISVCKQRFTQSFKPYILVRITDTPN